MSAIADRRPLGVPRYHHRHERAFAPDGLDARVAMHVRLVGGFFVESRARDGVRASRTLLFARYRGWKGLLIEPHADLAQRCRALRPESIVERATLVAPDQPAAGAPARTLSAILDAHGVRRVDLLCLELDGGDPEALRGLDLDRHRPGHLLLDAPGRGAGDELIGDAYVIVARVSPDAELYRLRSPVSRA